MHERQAVIFGVLLAALRSGGPGRRGGVHRQPRPAGLRARVRRRALPDRHAGPVPVPAGRRAAGAHNQVNLKVYNATTRVGLAGATAASLGERGFIIALTENAPATYDGKARIIFGTAGVAQAYTLAAHVDGAVLVLDARLDPTVDLALGAEFAELNPLESVLLDPAVPLVAPEGCTPFDQVVAPAAPAVTETPAAG